MSSPAVRASNVHFAIPVSVVRRLSCGPETLDRFAAERISDMAIAATTALQNKLQQVLTGGQAAPRGSFLSFVGGGRAVDEAALNWATKQPPYAGDADADAAMEFAQEVNTIPIAADDWTASTADMSSAYRDIWLSQARVPSVQLSDSDKAEREEAQTYIDEHVSEYEMYGSAWYNANSNLQIAVLTPRSDPNYLPNLLAARRDADRAREEFLTKGHKSLYEHATAVVDFYDRVGLQTALQDLIRRYDSERTENITSTGRNFVPVGLYPNRILGANAVGWNHFRISESEFSRYRTNTTTNVSAGANFNYLFWSAGADFQWGTERGLTSVTSTNLTVEFDFLRVRLDRSRWFDSFLLKSQSWWWPGATKSRPKFGGINFSDGAPPPRTTGQWQMIPTEMVLTRNLTVTTSGFDLRNSTFAQEANASASAGFWIFKTKANYKTATSREYTHTFTSNDTLSSPQPMISAFICELMPAEPNPDPTLLPAP
jgi:hypothetical protein